MHLQSLGRKNAHYYLEAAYVMYCSSTLDASNTVLLNTLKNRAYIDLCRLRHLNNTEQSPLCNSTSSSVQLYVSTC